MDRDTEMTTEQQIDAIVKDQYSNYKPLIFRRLEGLHKMIRFMVGDELFLIHLKESKAKNPRPVYTPPKFI